MSTIPTEAYALIGALIGASITLATTWLTQRGQSSLEERKIREARAQLIFKEKSEKVHQLAVDLSAIAYSFLWVTWNAEHGALDQNTLQQYWSEIQKLMPRLYGDYVLIAGLDDELGELAASLLDQADILDMSIGEATLNLSKENLLRLKNLHPNAEAFAKSVATDLAAGMKKNRLLS
jgi:hypothetical protein